MRRVLDIVRAIMTPQELRVSAQKDPTAPNSLSAPLQGLWHDARGEWDAAHACVQEDKSRDGAWVHAYLHRKEGDAGNAGYWYARAGRKSPASGVTLDAEWDEIARTLLG